MGRNKLLQRGDFSCPKRGDLTHLWKPSSLFIASVCSGFDTTATR